MKNNSEKKREEVICQFIKSPPEAMYDIGVGLLQITFFLTPGAIFPIQF